MLKCIWSQWGCESWILRTNDPLVEWSQEMLKVYMFYHLLELCDTVWLDAGISRSYYLIYHSLSTAVFFVLLLEFSTWFVELMNSELSAVDSPELAAFQWIQFSSHFETFYFVRSEIFQGAPIRCCRDAHLFTSDIAARHLKCLTAGFLEITYCSLRLPFPRLRSEIFTVTVSKYFELDNYCAHFYGLKVCAKQTR